MSQLAGYNTQQNVAVLTAGSVAGGTALLPILIAPFGGMTITSAKLSAQTAVNAGTVNYATFTLINGGTAGTASDHGSGYSSPESSRPESDPFEK